MIGKRESVATGSSRSVRMSPQTLNDAERSVEVIASTEDRVLVPAYQGSRQVIEEVLISQGAVFPERVGLLENHNRRSVDAVLGSAFGFRVDGSNVLVRVQFAEGDPLAERTWNKVRQGHIDSVSVGYHQREFVDIPPRQTRSVAGRIWTAGERTLRITTKWEPFEVSVVTIGADPKAKVRGHIMNPELRAYLESIGLRSEATEEQAQTFHENLGGAQRSAADNFLNPPLPSDPAPAPAPATPAPAPPSQSPQTPAPAGQRTVADPVPVVAPTAPAATQPAATPPAVAPQDPAPVATRTAADDERDRVTTIMRMAGDDVPRELAQRAITEGWTTERSSVAFLDHVRNSRGEAVNHSGPAIHTVQRDRESSTRGLSAALMMRSGLNLENANWAASPAAASLRIPEWLRGAQSRFASDQQRDVGYRYMEIAERYRTYSLLDMCREGLHLSGQTVPHDRAEMIRAAVSTADVQNLFTTNIGAQLLASYEASPDTTQGWVREADIPNFQTQERPRLGKSSALEKLPRGDTAKHTTISDKLESYKIARYARQLVIDEQDLVDDRFDALRDLPMEMGEAARQLRPDLVYSILMGNPTMGQDSTALFHANHNNLQTSAALTAANLKVAITDMGTQQEDGRNLGIFPHALLVPMGLKHTAMELVNSASMFFVNNSGAEERGTRNPLVDENLTIISDSRLDNGVTDPASGAVNSGSGTTWFMAARGGRHTIEVGYLSGTGRAPQVRSFMLDRGQYGIGWDIKMDIGAKALDFRGFNKNTT